MTGSIHGASHKAIKHLRKESAALAIFWIYASRTNEDNVAWPSLRKLAEDTEWSAPTCQKGRAWLVKHGALEPVKNYVRPEWRALAEAERVQKLNLDHTEYYRPTGILKIDGETIPLLYFGSMERSTLEDSPSDVQNGCTSTPLNIKAVEHQNGSMCKAVAIELDSSTTELDSKKEQKNDDIPNEISSSAAAKSKPVVKKNLTTPEKQTVPAAQMTAMKNALAAEFGWKWPAKKGEPSPAGKVMTGNQVGMIQAAAKQLCEANYTPEDVPVIYRFCKRKFETFKPTALPTWASQALAEQTPNLSGWEAYADQEYTPPPTLPKPQDNPDVPEPIRKAWRSAMSQLEVQLARASFETWLRDAVIMRIDGETWVIGVANQYAADMCQHRLYRNVRRVASDGYGQAVELRFEVYTVERSRQREQLA